MPDLHRYLNNIFRHQSNYDAVHNAIKNNDTKGLKKNLRELLPDIEIDSGDLVYTPEQMTILPQNQIATILKEEYDDLNKSLGLGSDKLYEVVRDNYIGITRTRVREFLKQQPSHQITKTYRKAVNKPVLAKKVNERWSIDLVDMNPFLNHNNGYRYIMNVVDVFSRYLMSRPLKNKTAKDVEKAFADMCDKEEATPKILMSDNGGEFKGELTEFCEANEIRQIFTRSYTPQANGLVEGINKLIREKLKDGMVRLETRRWTKVLQNAVKTWNNTPHGNQKYSPMWYFHSPDDVFEEERAEAREVQERRAEKAIQRTKSLTFNVGDVVRISLRLVSSQIRKQVKQGNKKNVLVKWSPELYKVKTIIKGNVSQMDKDLPENQTRKLSNQSYTVEPLDDNETRNVDDKRFFGSDLQLVARRGDDIPDNAQKSRDLTRKLNRFGHEPRPVNVRQPTRRTQTELAQPSSVEPTNATRREEQRLNIQMNNTAPARTRREVRLPSRYRE